METECKTLYGEDISWKLEEFRTLDSELKLKVIASEENVVFGRLSKMGAWHNTHTYTHTSIHRQT